MSKTAMKKERPSYIPCKGNNFGKHKFERLKHNAFEKCMLCGEPRFALIDKSLTRENGPLAKFMNEVLR